MLTILVPVENTGAGDNCESLRIDELEESWLLAQLGALNLRVGLQVLQLQSATNCNKKEKCVSNK